jgi:hypothetical protein
MIARAGTDSQADQSLRLRYAETGSRHSSAAARYSSAGISDGLLDQAPSVGAESVARHV